MSTKQTCEGRCLCGAVTFSCSEGPLWSLYCHCESCRLNTASPVTAFFGVRDGAWEWTGAEPGLFESTRGVRRYFCKTCGTPMAYQADKFPDETHFYISALKNPDGFEPTGHVHSAERLHWFNVADDLPRWKGTLGGERI